MGSSGEYYHYIKPAPSTIMAHTTDRLSLDQVVQHVKASIMPEVEKTVNGAVTRHCDGIIGRVIGRVNEEVHSSISGTIERLERRQAEQEENMNDWKAKMQELDTKLHDVNTKCNETLDRIGTVVDHTNTAVGDIVRMMRRMDALESFGQVGNATLITPPPDANPLTPGPDSPHEPRILGSRIQHTSDVLGGFGRPRTKAFLPEETPRAAAASPSATRILETRSGYERCPYCQRELTIKYMMGAHRRLHCKKSPYNTSRQSGQRG